MIRKIVKRILGERLIRKLYILFFEKNQICKNVNQSNFDKSCLLLYVIAPFLQKKKKNIYAKRHQAYIQVLELARIVGEFEYNVDVIQFDNFKAKINKNYDLVIDLNPGLNNLYINKLTINAKKIAYFTGSENIFAYNAELSRLKDLKTRRGFELRVILNIPPVSKQVEEFDGVFFIGNEYNLQTFKDYKLPKTILLPNTGYPLNITFNESIKQRNCFISFLSQGNIHRGLDLLLDIFGQPDFSYELYICGPVEGESDFCRVYYHELYNCKNIHLIGFLDITSKRFEELCSKCCYSLLPSCSEGQSGCVLTMMSAGIIPIVSKECGFDDSDVINLPDCSIETIETYIRKYAEKDFSWCMEQSKRETELVKTKYSIDSYRSAVYNGLNAILNKIEI